MTKQERARVKARALEDYRRGDALKVIAIRFGVSLATISLWARSAGMKRRQQGCRIKARPDERAFEIVNAVKAVKDGKPTLAEIGKRWKISRANVHRIYHKWKDWEPVTLFEPGDKIRLDHHDYEVIEPGVFEGKVREVQTGQESKVRWKDGENIAVKLHPAPNGSCGHAVGAASTSAAAVPNNARSSNTLHRNAERASSVTTVTSVTDQFPMNVLPPMVRQVIEEVADVATVPAALPACQALGIISSALGAGLAIPSDREQKTFGNLFIIPAAESGCGKSVTFNQLMAPAYAYQQKLRDRAQALHYDLKAELLRLKGTLKRVEAGKEPITDDLLPGLIRRKEEIEAELKRRPKTVCEDVTREKLQVLLAQNDERIFSASADARQVIQAVLHGKGDNPYLKAWSGDPVDVDRISRDAVPLKAPRMALLWLPQPDLMTDMFTRRILTVNGFLPRVLPCIVEYAPMLLSSRTRRIAASTEKGWSDLVRGLFETYHAKKGAPFVLRREAKVQPLLIAYYNSVVERRRNELSDVGPFAARWAEQAWRLIVVLHAASHGRDAHHEAVQSRTAEDAISLMDFFSGQQLELLRRTRACAKTEAVEEVCEMLAGKSQITARDVLRERITQSADEARALLEQMVRDGKLACTDHRPEGGGHTIRYYHRCDGRDT